ncbi:MAG: hypothetical protein CME90_20090 [Hoeflea sp.]|nr:hypothetical protein [Hoeflea sp.]|tara:strand:- start:13051 stop:13962 length:912 start_codon:yes stop_codon:yes gene_type:complete
MTTAQTKSATRPTYTRSADCPDLQKTFHAFLDDLVEGSMSVEALTTALAGTIDDLSSIFRLQPSLEGQLIEFGIGAVARCNPDLKVLTRNLRLPVLSEALQIVEMNDADRFRALTFNADLRGYKTYTPDLVILNQKTRTAHVVDAKRSVYTYDRLRLDELQKRMKAAGLVLPDFLYKEHKRLAVSEVRVVIISADDRKTDLENGIWHLSQLDHLIEVDGAGKTIAALQQTFRTRVEANWTKAREAAALSGGQASGAQPEQFLPIDGADPDDERDPLDDEATDIGSEPGPHLIRLGFAQAPVRH